MVYRSVISESRRRLGRYGNDSGGIDMSIIEITSDAKCKDCKFFKREPIHRKDGSLSMKSRLVCEKGKRLHKGESTIACNEFKGFWEE